MVRTLALALTLVFCGCSSDHHDEDGHHRDEGDGGEGTPTESICPTPNQLSYETFGRAFMEAYCTRCHSSTLTGAARNGAPLAHDFDTVAGIAAVAEHIDEFAAAGPKAVNVIMPPDDPKPSEEDRRKLGQWLACKTPTAVADAGSAE
ncbi:MAG TPA: cytochrome c [Polyangiaceae bacterium]|nr:cytochrome c [Polyangiaceae bacterium]